MSDKNVIREEMLKAGMSPRPRSEWSDEQKIDFDRLLYGTGFGRRRPDGTIEHIPATEMVVSPGKQWQGKTRR